MILAHNGIDIFYTDEGSGDAIVLIHGFLEDHSMWQDIGLALGQEKRVITIDLLGHGRTGCLHSVHTMTNMATAIESVLSHLGIEESIMIGHSMGGYVALAFAKMHPESIRGLCLMNSTYEEDDEERKDLRTRANAMVEGNFENMVRMSFANLFSIESRIKFEKEFEAALEIALKTPIKGYIAAQEGMKLREDHTLFFVEAEFKKAVILGEKDSFLVSSDMAQFMRGHGIPVTVLSEGHMSHIENKTECINGIMHFIEKI